MTNNSAGTKPVHVGELADLVSAEVVGNPNCRDEIVVRTGPVTDLASGVISFVTSDSFLQIAKAAKGGVVVVSPELFETVRSDPGSLTWLIHPDPITVIAAIQARFHPFSGGFSDHFSGGLIQGSAGLGSNVTVGSGSTVGEESRLGEGTVIHPGSHVMDSVVIGSHTTIFPNVVIYPNTVIGSNCIIHAGAVIGADGFRFHHAIDGAVVKFPHAGNVVIRDRVEIGANSTIDRSTFSGDSTTLGDDVKIDNQVHIAHNVKISAGVTIAAQTCVSGSVVIGERTWIGAGVTISDSVTVGSNAQLLVNAVVVSDVPDGARFSGFYATDHMIWKRAYLKMIQRSGK
jgi:UDP-3-O-[3-hydroxymyristoyl] glucosamine N-acyltransferase